MRNYLRSVGHSLWLLVPLAALVYFAYWVPVPAASAACASPCPAVVDGSIPGQSGVVTFSIANRSNAPIQILDVTWCCGTRVIDALVGLTIAAQQSVKARVGFQIPDAGVMRQTVKVYYTGCRAPLELTAVVSSSHAPPYIADKSRARVVFFDLDSPAATGSMIVSTCEPAGRPPWLGASTCPLPGVAIDPNAEITEQRVGSLTMRRYSYRVGWSSLPTVKEFFGPIHVTLRYDRDDAAGTNPIEVGEVVGTRRMLPYPLRPLPN